MSLGNAIRTIKARWPHVQSPSAEEPVFVFAAGWRSGSTLVQRMLMRQCMIWGEPFGRATLIDSLSHPLQTFTDNWPPDAVFRNLQESAKEELTREWIANLYPPPDALLNAHVGYVTTLYRAPAQELGYARWGFKEVRLTYEHAIYLKWLFPKAKFVFLYRNPYACYRSFQSLKAAYVRWPDQPINSPETFGQHWVRLAQGFVSHHRDVDGIILKYEDLSEPTFDPTSVNRYLGFEIDMTAREVKVGSSGKQDVPPAEHERLRQVVGGLAGQLGYDT
jgi:hypothetical protein